MKVKVQVQVQVQVQVMVSGRGRVVRVRVRRQECIEAEVWESFTDGCGLRCSFDFDLDYCSFFLIFLFHLQVDLTLL